MDSMLKLSLVELVSEIQNKRISPIELMTAVIERLTDLLELNRDNLTVEPARAAILLRGLIFVYSHQLLNPDQHMTPEQLVSALCNGILTPEAR